MGHSAAGVLVGLTVYYRIAPTPILALLPLFVILALIAALAVGICVSALNVQYRGVRYTVPFLSQMWMYATPVVYASSQCSFRSGCTRAGSTECMGALTAGEKVRA